MSDALLIENLHYSYRHQWTGVRRTAVQDLSLTVKAGEVFGFLGHNGAGKTTTIKAMLGLIKPSKGRISVFGTDSRRSDARRGVGYLPEQPYFYDALTVEETLRFYATLSEVPRDQIMATVRRSLERLGIADRAKSKMRSLSKGLTQRVAMAQAIVASPKLLVLDEPFSGLDPLGRKEFRELLMELKGQGTTILISTHILNDVEVLCDRASILVRGQLKGVYDMRELPVLHGGHYELMVRGDESVRAHLIGANSIATQGSAQRALFRDAAAAHAALRRALDQQLDVQLFEFVHGSLEDIFMKHMQSEERQR